ncbi:MAG: GIY-YIG nuclease family protein [Candidatus Omnitrophica bacterium]|nr:GIY-YIG nuclease family protein [Candidatus Omnitrophota bacterium]
MKYTYVLLSHKDRRWYTGWTTDLRHRVQEHQAGQVPSTKGRGPFALIYYEACLHEGDAVARERYLKSGMGKRYLKNRLARFLAQGVIALGLAFTALTGQAEAAVKYWVGGTAGNFSDANRWATASGGTTYTTTPGSSDVATFDGGGTADCTITADVTVGSLNITSAYPGTSTLTVNTGIKLSLLNNLTLSGGTLSNLGTIEFTATGNGQNSTLTCSGSFPGTVVINKGPVDYGWSGTFTLASGCTLDLGASPTTSIGGGMTNNGTVTIPSGTWTHQRRHRDDHLCWDGDHHRAQPHLRRHLRPHRQDRDLRCYRQRPGQHPDLFRDLPRHRRDRQRPLALWLLQYLHPGQRLLDQPGG